MRPLPILKGRVMRVTAAAGVATIVAVTGAVAGHSLRPSAAPVNAVPSPTRSATPAATSTPATDSPWTPTPAPAELASATLFTDGSEWELGSGVSASTGAATVPIYLLDRHTDHTSDDATIAKSLGMSRHAAGGTPDRQIEPWTHTRIYDPDASLGIDRSGTDPYIIYNDAQRGPGCLAQVRTCTPSTAAAPTGDAAIKQLTRVMTKLGFNTGSFTFSAQPLPSATPSTLVWALPATHGAPLDEDTLQDLDVWFLSGGATWSATVTADGIVRLEAYLVEVTEVTTVQTLTPAASLARSTEPAFSLASVGGGDPFEATLPALDTGSLVPGAAIPWIVIHDELPHVALISVRRPAGDGKEIALPYWRFSHSPDRQVWGGGFGEIALPDSALRLVPRTALTEAAF